MYIDVHCHIDDAAFTDKRAVVSAAEQAGVKKMICSGCDVNSSAVSREIAESFSSVYYSVALHPEHAESFDAGVYDGLKNLVDKKCVAVGEIGLDYHYEPFDKNKQAAAFISLINLADEVKLPIVVHSRDAHADTLEILKTHRPKYGGVMHCFSGSKEIAKEYFNLGFYLSFGGTLTFKNAVRSVEVLKYSPIDRVLTETDCPYLAPEPLRGSVNEPKNIPFIVKKMAEIKGLSDVDIATAVEKNAKTVFYKLK